MKNLGKILTIGMFVTAGVFAYGGPAQAAPPPTEYDTAVVASPSAVPNTVSRTGAKVGFDPAGDILWVYDSEADGASAVMVWKDYLDNGSGNFERSGVCRNSSGYGTWAKCNKNLPEGSTIKYQAATLNDGTYSTGSAVKSVRVDG